MTEIRCYCDKCGKEIKEYNHNWVVSYLQEEEQDKIYQLNIQASFCNEFGSFNNFGVQLCPKCNKNFCKKLKDLINKELLKDKVQIWNLNGE